MSEENGNDKITETITKHLDGLKAAITAFQNERENEKTKARRGKFIAIALGVSIALVGFFSPSLEDTPIYEYMTLLSGFLGLLVTLNGQYLNPEKRIKIASECSDIATELRIIFSDISIDIENDNLDKETQTATLNNLREQEKLIADKAVKGELKTDLQAIINRQFEEKKEGFFHR